MKSKKVTATAVGRLAANDNSWSRWDHIPEGHRLYSSPDTVRELNARPTSIAYKSRGRTVKWSDEKGCWVRVRKNADRAVFDIAQELARPLDETGAWTPPRVRGPKGVPVFRFGLDGPDEEHRIKAGKAWYSSHYYRGQLANDNKDWPLAKLLRAESNDHCLALAERYRALFDAATDPTELVGRDASDNVYVMADLRLDESTGKLVDKGTKKVAGKKARLDEPATRSVKADPDKTKKRAAPVPKKWNGDWPLLNKIDACRELAAAQSALGFLREAFEDAVCHGETLEAIGRRHGVGNEAGAKGGGRALVYLGLQAVDAFWTNPARRAS